MLVKFVQRAKAELPIDVKLLGRITLVTVLLLSRKKIGKARGDMIE